MYFCNKYDHRNLFIVIVVLYHNTNVIRSFVPKFFEKKRFVNWSSSYSNNEFKSSNKMGLNEIETSLRVAIKYENYKEAARLRDLIKERTNSINKLSWESLGTAGWLIDRLEALDYRIPTTIQMNAFESVNDMFKLEKKKDNYCCVISGITGSGKSLGFLLPMLSILSDRLFERQRIRMKRDDDLKDVADDFLDELLREGRERKEKTSLGKSNVLEMESSPLVLIVLPTKELGVQIATLLYELVGGNVRENVKSQDYQGPTGVRIGCIFDDNEAQYGLKFETDVAITTPKYLTKLLNEGDVNSNDLLVTMFDEADLVTSLMKKTDLDKLYLNLSPKTRLTFLVGASITSSELENYIQSEKTYIATSFDFEPKYKLDKPIMSMLDPSLRHERVIAPNNTALLYLCRMLRDELSFQPEKPRVIVFFQNESVALSSMQKLRDSLWGDFRLCALLPTIGTNPLQMMEEFRNNQTQVMLATSNSVRGLSFPNVTHVYTLYLPHDPREYIHLVGRLGRIGQSNTIETTRRVTCILQPSEQIQMDILAKTLNFTIHDLNLTQPHLPSIYTNDDQLYDQDLDETQVQNLKRYFEDKITLLDDINLDL